VWTTVVARGISGLTTRFNTCPPYNKVESKITLDFGAQCSMFTDTYIPQNKGFKVFT